MTVLRERMIEDMQLHGLSEGTQQNYVHTVRQLAKHYHKSPDQITEEELREYFLHLIKVKQVAPSTFRVALCGIKFFSRRTSGRCMSAPFKDSGPRWRWRAHPRRKSCRWSLRSRKCAKSLGVFVNFAISFVSVRSTPVGYGFEKPRTCGSKISMENEGRSTFVMEREAKTATYPCHNPFWECCVATG
jgi:hypothetical protein